MQHDVFATGLAHPGPDDILQTAHLYDRSYSEASRYPFPGYQRRDSRLLQLCGVTPLVPLLPAWWSDVVQLSPEPLRSLLSHLPAEDFYRGCLGERLVLEMESLVGSLRPRPIWARSPRLGKILLAFLPGGASHPLYRRYQERGSKNWLDLELVVSAHPWDILSMGSGSGFSTCQDLFGGDLAWVFNEKLPANLLDGGMAVAYVQQAGGDRWASRRMQARAIVRLLRSADGRDGILIDRCYGDSGRREALLAQLATLLAEAGLPLWIPPWYNTRGRVTESAGQAFPAYGPYQDFKGLPLPYLDQADSNQDFYWEPWSYCPRRTFHRLTSSVIEAAPDALFSPSKTVDLDRWIQKRVAALLDA